MFFSPVSPDMTAPALACAGHPAISQSQSASRTSAADAQESLGSRIIRLARLAATLHAAGSIDVPGLSVSSSEVMP
ncbi:MAG: hypothetical protein H7210_10970 [Pyrinomonadaceae bacterium]|nr:hypothetical protein [Phycisphaerales bacterium]